jgi:hypothetical protein
MCMKLAKGRKGQLGPQGLEDLPLVIMAFIVAVAVIIIYLNISTNHLIESSDSDLYNAGKRLVETLCGEAFKSDTSRAYGSKVLDVSLIEDADEAGALEGIINTLEYSFRAEIETDYHTWSFGSEIPNDFMVFKERVTLLSGSALHDGKISVKIWKK